MEKKQREDKAGDGDHGIEYNIIFGFDFFA